MNFACGKILCAAAGVEELADPVTDLIAWFAVMGAILLVALTVMLVKTRHR
ncbi:hypothetical protein [Streptomyces cyslabdanicus]